METNDALDGAIVKIRAKHDPTANVGTTAVLSESVDPVISAFYNVTVPTPEQAEMMAAIRDAALKQTGGNEDGLVDVLKTLRYKLADGSLSAAYKYIRLREEANRALREAEAIER